MALFPLHQAFRVKRVFAASYQAVSGTGAKAIEELARQVRHARVSRPLTKCILIRLPSMSCRTSMPSFRTGHTKEEMMITRRR